MTGRDGLRAALMAASLGAAALLYFGVLLAAGLRPRDFSRRGLNAPRGARRPGAEALNLCR